MAKKQNRFIVKGGAVPVAAQVLHFSAKQWESFIETACVSSGNYIQVKILGDAGDAGRDVEARLTPTLETDQWDLYQAKHYSSKLSPSSAFPELVKFFGHLNNKTYPHPRNYYFCSPKNAGPDLHDLIADPVKFKQTFITAWQAGTNGLKDFKDALTSELLALVQNFDFSKIKEFLVRDLLTWHALNIKEHHALFGIEAERGDDPGVPVVPTSLEQIYIQEMLNIYGEQESKNFSLSEAQAHYNYGEHLEGVRANFYCAEGLKRFSRDLYVEDEFGELLTMVHQGIRSHVTSPKHKTGLDRLEAALNAVSGVAVNDSKLSPRLRGGDLPGTCHHLVNDGKIKWVK